MLGHIAALVLSASMSFCTSSTESFSLGGHERAFIPSPPRGQVTPGRTLSRCLAPGPPVTLVRVGAWHSQGAGGRLWLCWGCMSCICQP